MKKQLNNYFWLFLISEVKTTYFKSPTLIHAKFELIISQRPAKCTKKYILLCLDTRNLDTSIFNSKF